jgi:hypothetical protein
MGTLANNTVLLVARTLSVAAAGVVAVGCDAPLAASSPVTSPSATPSLATVVSTDGDHSHEIKDDMLWCFEMNSFS